MTETQNLPSKIDRSEIDLSYSRFTPTEILRNRNLSHAACRLWLLMFIEYKRFLNLTENKRNVCCYYKTNRQLGELIGVSERQSERLVKELRECGYLLTLRNWNSSSYLIPIHPADVGYNATIGIYSKILEVRQRRQQALVDTCLPDDCYQHKPVIKDINEPPTRTLTPFDLDNLLKRRGSEGFFYIDEPLKILALDSEDLPRITGDERLSMEDQGYRILPPETWYEIASSNIDVH